jgi:hypothetical protein
MKRREFVSALGSRHGRSGRRRQAADDQGGEGSLRQSSRDARIAL